MPSTEQVQVARNLTGGWLWRIDTDTRTVSGVAYFTRKGAARAGRRWASKVAAADKWEAV